MFKLPKTKSPLPRDHTQTTRPGRPRKEPNRDIDVVGYDNYWHSAQERAWQGSALLATVDKDNRRLGAQLVGLLTERSKNNGQAETHLVRLIPLCSSLTAAE